MGNIPINLDQWIAANKDSLKPPIGNRQFWKESWQNLMVMIVGGPNYRPDYHDDPGEELFIQLRGDLTLKLIDPVNRLRSDVTVREGEMYLLPSPVSRRCQKLNSRNACEVSTTDPRAMPECCCSPAVALQFSPRVSRGNSRVSFQGEVAISSGSRSSLRTDSLWNRFSRGDRKTK